MVCVILDLHSWIWISMQINYERLAQQESVSFAQEGLSVLFRQRHLSNGMSRVLRLLYYCYGHFGRLLLFIRRWFGHRLNSCIADKLFVSSKLLHQTALVISVLGLLDCHPAAGSRWSCMLDDIKILYWGAAWFDYWVSPSASLLLIGMAFGSTCLPDKLCWLYAGYPANLCRRTSHCSILNLGKLVISANYHAQHVCFWRNGVEL